MTVDLEAIARRGHCEVSSLRNALPLLQQGYSPPFLARYRRDELGGIDEASLWALSAALAFEQAINDQRELLHAQWEATPLRDPSLGHAIRKSNSKRMLERLARRLKAESTENAGPADHLGVRVLNPRKGDGDDFAAIAEKLESVEDAGAAVAALDQALAKRLAGDPRVINAAVKWLSKHAKIFISSVSDPHTPDTTQQPSSASKPPQESQPASESPTSESPTEAAAEGGTSDVVAKPVAEVASVAADQAARAASTESEVPDDSESKPDAAGRLAAQTEPSATESPEAATEQAGRTNCCRTNCHRTNCHEQTATEQAANEQAATSKLPPSKLPPSKCHRANCHRANCHRANCHRANCHRANCHRASCHRTNCHRTNCHRKLPRTGTRQATESEAARRAEAAQNEGCSKAKEDFSATTSTPVARQRAQAARRKAIRGAGKLSSFQIVMLGRAPAQPSC